MTLSITNEKAANPPQPTAAACGPDLACRAAPVIHPLATEFHTSCFPLYFSTKQSDPPKTPEMKAKLRHQYNDLFAVARIVVLICSLNGAWGTSFPAITWTGGVASDMAPRKTPITKPIAPPPINPIAALPPQEFDSQLKSGGKSIGLPDCVDHGKKYGNDRRVSWSRLSSEPLLDGTSRCIAISWE